MKSFDVVQLRGPFGLCQRVQRRRVFDRAWADVSTLLQPSLRVLASRRGSW